MVYWGSAGPEAGVLSRLERITLTREPWPLFENMQLGSLQVWRLDLD